MASLRGKSKPKIKTLSKSKSSKAETVSKHASSDPDENGISIKTSRKSVKLREKVTKELKYLGLIHLSHSDTKLSDQESENSDNEYILEKPVSSKQSKKKRSKHSSRSSVSSDSASRKLLRIKVTPDLHLTYSKNGGNLGLVLKMKNIACLSILLTKDVRCTYLCFFFNLFYTVL